MKAAVKDFKEETNFSVITSDGSFYSFNVEYSENPRQLSIEMKNVISTEEKKNESVNQVPVRLNELDNTPAILVEKIMK